VQRRVAARVCERIATTPQSLADICESSDMPGIATVFRWLHRHPEFREMYVIAKQEQVEILMDECIQIVDNASKDVIVTKDGRTILNPVAVQRAKLQVSFRQWTASKLHPRKYGVIPHLYPEENDFKRQPPQTQTKAPPPQKPQEDIRAHLRDLLGEFWEQEQAQRLAARAAQSPSNPTKNPASTPPTPDKP
jgi:hypothetical protein